MGKKSITIDVDDSTLKKLHILAIDIDVSRKSFIEKCVELVASKENLLTEVKQNILKEKPGE